MESKRAGGVLAAPGLASAVARAKAENMPKDNIERAITKGTSKDSGNLEHIQYEAYGPAGVALIVEALTDNKNRTTPEIKHIFSKLGFEIAAPGSASWAFTKVGATHTPNEPLIEINGVDEEKLVTILESLDEHEDVQQIFTNARGYENSGN
jgi:transcriptional/translational regulatory protein YebC/TACO1